MFCKSCGKEMPEDSLFCPECGGKVEQSSETKVEVPVKKELSPEEKEKIKKRNTIIIIASASAAVLCIIIAILVLTLKSTINLNKYMILSAEGYDTVGKAVLEFDEESFNKDHGKKIGKAIEKSLADELGEYGIQSNYFGSALSEMYGSKVASAFYDSVVDGSVDKEDGLSNGDVITYTWDCDEEEALEVYGVKLKYKDIEYTVEGLEEAETFDPFEGIEVTFSGIAPNGRVEINTNEMQMSELNFQPDKYDGLSVGDTVTIDVNVSYGEDIIQYCIDTYDMVPSVLSKEYTVEGLDSYLKSVSEISDETLKAMDAQAIDVFKAKVVADFDETETLKRFDYVGNYLLTNKDPNNYYDNNNLYLVYKATINNNYTNGGKTYNQDNVVYWYILYENILVNDTNGTTVDITCYGTPSNRCTIDSEVSSGWFGTVKWDYYGYQDLNDLYNEVVTKYIDVYNHEDNIDETLVPVAAPEVEETVSEGGMIFANSSEEIIDADKISELSDDDLRFAINELYAKHGYIFKDEELQKYYSEFDWYEGSIESSDFTMDMFNDVERENVEKMQEERDSRI